jgi:CubicO group peptidase (beta-lactamase class C family)
MRMPQLTSGGRISAVHRGIQSSFLILLLATTALAQDTTRIDQAIQEFVPGQFMGSVLVARGDKILFSKGYGLANLEWGIPNTPETKFRIASLTKQFTAACVLLLEERGKLKVDDRVKKHIADVPAAWDKITIFNLLTHTAGIPDFTGFADYRTMEPFATTPEQLVARFRDKPLEFEPVEKMNYSNSGYILLGYLIEKISGQTYEGFVQDNIFTRLGMKDSGYDSNSAVIPRRAVGYSAGANGPVNARYIDMSIPYSAGALYSTTEDLLRWQRALFSGKLLSSASLQKMTTPFNGYGFGLSFPRVQGRETIAHNGGIEGFNTWMSYYPESQVTVIVLANLNGDAPETIGAIIGDLAHAEATSPDSRK